MFDSTELIRKLVSLQGPPGQETEVSLWISKYLEDLGYLPRLDGKGNVVVEIEGDESLPTIMITAHLDEIALMATAVEADGKVRVTSLGGAYPWKWGEAEVDILASKAPVPGVLSFGGIHTNHPKSVVENARRGPLTWDMTYIFTGLNAEQAAEAGVRPGLRVVLAQSKRIVKELERYICSYFLDDRADLAVWLMALESLKEHPIPGLPRLIFAATVSEEIGGLGAKFLLNDNPAEICVALEIGPKTPEADFEIDANPSIWVQDGYAPMEAVDGEILERVCAEIGMTPHWQFLSRGGSDASCAAAIGLTARPVTLGLLVENSHGFEIMHRDAPKELLKLLLAYLASFAKSN